MKRFWIILIVFAFVQGNYSLPVEHQTGEDVSSVLTLASMKNRPEEHTDNSNGNAAKANGVPSTLDKTQEPSSHDTRSHESHAKMSDESHGLISGRLDKLFGKYSLGRGISKKVMRLLRLRRHDPADNSNGNAAKANGGPSTLDKTQEPSSHDTRSHESHAKMSDESHGLISGRLDKLFGKYSLGRGISKKVMRLLRLRRHDLATDIGKTHRDSNHESDKGGGLHLEVPTRRYPRKLTTPPTPEMENVSVEPSIRERLQGIDISDDIEGESGESPYGLFQPDRKWSKGMGKHLELDNLTPDDIEGVSGELTEDLDHLDMEWSKHINDDFEPDRLTTEDDDDERESNDLDQPNSEWSEEIDNDYEPDQLTTEDDDNERESNDLDQPVREWIEAIGDDFEPDNLTPDDIEGVSGELTEELDQPDGQWSEEIDNDYEPDRLTTEDDDGEYNDLDQPDSEWSEDIEKHFEPDNLTTDDIEEVSGDLTEELDQLDGQWSKKIDDDFEADQLTTEDDDDGESNDLDQPNSEWSEEIDNDYEPDQLTTEDDDNGRESNDLDQTDREWIEAIGDDFEPDNLTPDDIEGVSGELTEELDQPDGQWSEEIDDDYEHDQLTTEDDDGENNDLDQPDSEWSEDIEKHFKPDNLTTDDIEEVSGELTEELDQLDGQWSEEVDDDFEPDQLTTEDDDDEGESDDLDQPNSEWSEDMEKHFESDNLTSDDVEGKSNELPDDLDESGSGWSEDVEKHIKPDDLKSYGIEGESSESTDRLDQPDGEWGKVMEEDLESDKLTSDGNEESYFASEKRAAPEHGHESFKNAESNIELNTKRQFPMPASGIRWRGVSMAHHRSQDGGASAKKSKRTKDEDDGDTGLLLTLPIVVFVLLVVLLMTAFFIYSWPVRRYYARLNQRDSQEDNDSGWFSGELSSIHIGPNDPGCPAEVFVPVPPPPPSKKATKPSANAKRLVKVRKALKGNQRATQAGSILDKTSRRSLHEVLCEDRKRDYRNAERRKAIKTLTSQKRDSLVNCLLAAKVIIDGHAKSKEFEEKAYERRHKIKQFNSIPGAPHNRSKRRSSFIEDIQNACSVITPHWADDIKLEQAKEKCRRIKNQISGKRRPSLLDEIEVAKSVIMESPKKYALRPGLVEEMVSVGLDPNDYCSYYVVDYSKDPSKTGTCVLEMGDAL